MTLHSKLILPNGECYMRVRKKLIVVAFDISSDKIRRKAVSVLKRYGKRLNKSVFECVVTDSQYRCVTDCLKSICSRKDSIVIIPLCINCFSKIISMPQSENKDIMVVKVLD